MRSDQRGPGCPCVAQRGLEPVVDRDEAAQPDPDGMAGQPRIRVLDGQLQSRQDEQAVPPPRALGFRVDLVEVGRVGLGPDVGASLAVHDVIRDREHVEAGAAVEVDELARVEDAVAPRRVRVQLREQRSASHR